MKAIVYREYGSPDVLRLEEVATPAPQADEVLVKVHAASVNDWDWGLLIGKPLANRVGGIRTPKHPTLGSDVAGSVEAVGSQVTRFRPGDEVFGDLSACGFGAFAEFACARETAWALKPAGLSWEQAAAVPQAGALAVAGLSSRQPIAPGQQVLVNGAGGGAGSFAVQIAKSYGAEVTGVDKAGKLELMRAVGADHVVDYTREDFTKSGRQYDLILEAAAHRSISDYRRVLRPQGVCNIIGGSTPWIMAAVLLGPLSSAVGGKRVRLIVLKANRPGDVALLTRLLEAGSVVPAVDRVFPLAQTAEALRYFGTGEHKGKIVITM